MSLQQPFLICQPSMHHSRTLPRILEAALLVLQLEARRREIPLSSFTLLAPSFITKRQREKISGGLFSPLPGLKKKKTTTLPQARLKVSHSRTGQVQG